MKYLCLVYHSEKLLDAMSAAESQALTDEALRLRRRSPAKRKFHRRERLTVRPNSDQRSSRGGKVSVTDGPFAETNEQIGGS